MSDIFQIIRTNNIKEYYSVIDTIDVDTLNDYKQNLLQESLSYISDDISYDLIKRGVNLNNKDVDGKTSLHYCAAHNNYDIAKKILEEGGNINICDNQGNNPLWVAVFNARGVYNIVKLFVVYKANVNSKNNANKSPLDFAKQIEDEELIEILVHPR
jgi:ankyrin repeat protein